MGDEPPVQLASRIARNAAFRNPPKRQHWVNTEGSVLAVGLTRRFFFGTGYASPPGSASNFPASRAIVNTVTGALKAEYAVPTNGVSKQDGLHPNRAGYLAMGASIDLDALVRDIAAEPQS